MDYRKVDSPVFYPGRCFCGNQQGPLVDTLIEQPMAGHLYLCHKCVRVAAMQLGWTEPANVEALEQELADRDRQLQETLAALEAERADKVVKVSDLADYLTRQKTAAAKTKAPASAQA